MSWFYLKDQPDRKLRTGIWIRYHAAPRDFRKKIRRMLSPLEVVRRVIIQELRPDDQVLLEVWARSLLFDIRTLIFRTRHTKSTVCHLVVKENPEWVCEGDMGRGLTKKSKPGRSCWEGIGEIHDNAKESA